MLRRHVVLVNEAAAITPDQLEVAAAAIQKQVDEQFGPIWGVHGKVETCATLNDVPVGSWPVVIKDTLERAGAAGYHEDDFGEPRAFVLYTPDWTVTVSHEVLELLADPWGRHMVAGPSPRHPDRQVKFLVEVCDPCSDSSYEVDGVAVSDFYLPHFFDRSDTSGTKYSYAGTISKPQQVLEGGYLTWFDPEINEWWHRAWFDGPEHVDAKIPIPALVKGNLRAAIDAHVRNVRPAGGHRRSHR